MGWQAAVVDSRAPVVATIVARNYLPAARVLFESYRRHHPGAQTAVLVTDAVGDEVDQLAAQLPGTRVLGPMDLGLEATEFARMAMAYSLYELCTSLKAFLLRRLIKDYPVVIYLDPDIEVFGPFGAQVAKLAAEHEIVLTPHVLEPMPRDGLRPSEADIMAVGVFNLGFIAVSAKATRFLEFWAERLRRDGISSVPEQLFTDQRWVDHVPAIFRHMVISDPGYNVAYWNVYQRPLTKTSDGTVMAGGVPLRFYHYSGYDLDQPWLVTKHFPDRPRVLLSEQPLLAELCSEYRAKLIEAGYRSPPQGAPYRWGGLSDGSRLPLSLRRVFRQAWVDAERDRRPAPPSPFLPAPAEVEGNAEAEAEFLRWATDPANPEQQRAGLNRWAMAVWESRPDLRQTFPDPLHADADGFRFWCATSGVAEGELHPDAVSIQHQRPAVQPSDTLGVNVLGYLTAELGVGELGRLVHAAVARSGIPMATVVEESTVVNRTEHPVPDESGTGEPKYPMSLLCVNADMTAITLRLHPDLGCDRYRIGVWSWELAEFPEQMRKAFDLVDEVWTISEFCAKAIAAAGPVPVHTFPVPVRGPLPNGSERRRPDGQTRFLFIFDYNSIFDRKNPLAPITAFQQAFQNNDDARLVIKSINGDQHPAERERLRAAAAGDARIELIERYLDTDQVRKLYANADCYVSLHRSEGFGLTVAESMAHGLPVIATNYAGTAELLSEQTGWPVPYELVNVGAGNQPYPAGAHWAEPDLDAAAAAMRAVAGDPAEASRRGLAARRHVLSTRSEQAAADWVRARLTAGYQEYRRRRSGPPQPAPSTSAPAQPLPAPGLTAVHTSREPLRWRPDVDVPSRLPVAPVLRKAVLRVIDHYDRHQREMLSTLLDSVDGALDRLTDQVSAQLAELRAGTAALAEHVDQLHAQTIAQLGQLEHGLAGARAELAAESRAQLTAERAARAEQIRELTARLGWLGTADAHKHAELVDALRERDERLAYLEGATGDILRTLHPLHEGLRRHHDLLSPPPELPTEPVATDIGVLRLPAEDTVVLPWLRTYGCWEVEESRLINVLLRPGDTFVDIGAHVGYFTVRALRRVGAGGMVCAVEPWQRVRELLELNVAANVRPELSAAALTVLPVAAWDADGPLRLALAADGNSGDNRICTSGRICAPGAIEVTGVRLDGVAALAGRRIDVVKCDAQGRDQRALAGLTSLFDVHRPHVICEFCPDAIAEAGADPAGVLRQYRSWRYAPAAVSAELVAAVESAAAAESTSAVGAAAAVGAEAPALPDEELVELARAAPGGFITLWLRPAAAS